MINDLEQARKALQQPTGKFYSKGFDFNRKGTYLFGDDNPCDTLDEALGKTLYQCEYFFVLDCSQAPPMLHLIEKYERGEHPLLEWIHEELHECLECNGITIDRRAEIYSTKVGLEDWIIGAQIKFDYDGCKFIS